MLGKTLKVTDFFQQAADSFLQQTIHPVTLVDLVFQYTQDFSQGLLWVDVNLKSSSETWEHTTNKSTCVALSKSSGQTVPVYFIVLLLAFVWRVKQIVLPSGSPCKLLSLAQGQEIAGRRKKQKGKGWRALFCGPSSLE